MRAEAFRDHKLVPVRQPISGYVLEHRSEEVWRVRIWAGSNSYLSQREYANERSASSAARLFNLKRAAPLQDRDGEVNRGE